MLIERERERDKREKRETRKESRVAFPNPWMVFPCCSLPHEQGADVEPDCDTPDKALGSTTIKHGVATSVQNLARASIVCLLILLRSMTTGLWCSLA